MASLSLLIHSSFRWQIHNNIADIYDELEEEMTGFKDLTDDLWRDMLRIGSKTQFRRRRDAGYERNKHYRDGLIKLIQKVQAADPEELVRFECGRTSK